MTPRFRVAALLAALVVPSFGQTPPLELASIGKDAYTFAYPLVLMEYTRRTSVERAGISGTVGAMNRFTHAQEFPNEKFRQVIRPNADTLYSSSWIDVSKEPVLMHVPATERYYLMQFMDAWTETFAVPGTRTTGTGEGWFAIVGPNWKGKIPERAKRIDAPTNMVWLIGRTQTNSAADYEFVRAIQRGYLMMPLSLYPDGPPKREQAPRAAPGPPPAMTPPMTVAQLSTEEFFNTFAQLLASNPPHPDDAPMVKQLARAGIVAGKPFKLASLGADAKAFDEAAKAEADRIGKMGRTGPMQARNGWTGGAGKVGRYGTDYNSRAVVARIGLGANPPEDATYLNCRQDKDGKPLDGANNYVLHFEKNQIPPVRAFWSVTMYSIDGYFVKNPIDRFAIGDRDKLQFNADGSLDLYIQNSSPGKAKESNWLPAPAAGYDLSFRLYWPKEEILNGTWRPPALAKR